MTSLVIPETRVSSSNKEATFNFEENVFALVRQKLAGDEPIDLEIGKKIAKHTDSLVSKKGGEKRREALGKKEHLKKRFQEAILDYHQRIKEEILMEQGEIADNLDRFLDPLSIGIIFELYDQGAVKNFLISDPKRPSQKIIDFNVFLQSKEYQILLRETLFSLAQSTVNSFAIGDSKEKAFFKEYLKVPKIRAKIETPKVKKEIIDNGGTIKTAFLVLLEENPLKFLRDYFFNYRFIADSDSPQLFFDLGSLVTRESFPVFNEKKEEAFRWENFINFLKKEDGFSLEDRYWQKKVLELAGKKFSSISNFLHPKPNRGNLANNSLLKRKLVENADGHRLVVKSNFLKVFKKVYNRDPLLFALLYGLKDNLGMGLMTEKELIKKGNEVLPSLQRAKEIILEKFLNDNFDSFYHEFVFYAQNGFFGSKIKERCSDIFRKSKPPEKRFSLKKLEGEKETDYAKRVVHFIEFKDLVLNSIKKDKTILQRLSTLSYLDMFEFGDEMANWIKKIGLEKIKDDRKREDKVKKDTEEEDLSIDFMIKREIEDPQGRDRMLRALGETSHLFQSRFEKPAYWLRKYLFKISSFAQKAVSLPEGDTYFVSNPKNVLQSLAYGLIPLAGTALYGQFVNHILESPVNHGVQELFFMGGYFALRQIGGMVGKRMVRPEASLSQIATEKIKYFFAVQTPYLKQYFFHSIKSDRFNREEGIRLYGLKKKRRELIEERKAKKKTKREELAWKLEREKNERKKHNLSGKLENSIKYIAGLAPYYATTMAISYGISQANSLLGLGLEANPQTMAMAVMASSILSSGLMSGVGMRKGSEWMAELVADKKYLDKGINLIMGVDTPREILSQSSLRKMRKKRKKKNNFSLLPKKIQEIRGRKSERETQINILAKFIQMQRGGQEKLGKEEIGKLLRLLNWMKEEETLLLTHNPHRFGKRIVHKKKQKKTNQPSKKIMRFFTAEKEDRDFIINNFEALKRIDQLREMAIKYGERNLSHRDMEEVFLFATENNIKQVSKMFSSLKKRRALYFLGSAITRAIFIEGLIGLGKVPLLKKAGEAIFGKSNVLEAQQAISSLNPRPEEVFNFSAENLNGGSAEVIKRVEELSNLMTIMHSNNIPLGDKDLLVENMLGMYNLTQRQTEQFMDVLQKDGITVADLSTIIHFIASYHQGQNELNAIASQFNGTSHSDLSQLVNYFIKNSPQQWVQSAVKNDHLAPLIFTFNQDLAHRLGIDSSHLTIEDQIAAYGGGKNYSDFFSGNKIFTLYLNHHGRKEQLVAVGNILTHFVGGLSKNSRQEALDNLLRLNHILQSSSDSLIEAITNKYYFQFLADSTSYSHGKLTSDTIIELSHQTVAWKIYSLLPENEKIEALRLLNQASEGNTDAFNSLYTLTLDHTSNPDKVFSTLKDSSSWELLLGGANDKNGIIAHTQENMIGLFGLKPVIGPQDINLNAINSLSGEGFINPESALSLAITGKVDLSLALQSLRGGTVYVVQDGKLVGLYNRDFQLSASYSDDDIAMLQSIEGRESMNNPSHLLNVIWRLFHGVRSGGSTPAVSLVESMSGGRGQFALNENQTSMIRRPDKYGPEYLLKLVFAYFREYIPNDLRHNFNPNNIVYRESSHNSEKIGIIGKLCYKFESFILAKSLVQSQGERVTDTNFLNFVNLGVTNNGIDIHGVEAGSLSLFGKHFVELNDVQKRLIIGSAQAPIKYFYSKQDGQYHFNPSGAIRHAITLVNNAHNLSPQEKITQVGELERMLEHVENKNFDDFPGKMSLPDNYAHNFIDSYEAEKALSLSNLPPEKIAQLREMGAEIVIMNGSFVIKLPSSLENIERILPSEVLNFTVSNPSLEVMLQFSSMMEHATLVEGGKYYHFQLPDGKDFYLPAWHMKDKVAVPGIAILRTDGVNTFIEDKTGVLSHGGMLPGSSIKPMIAYWLYKYGGVTDDTKFNVADTIVDGVRVVNAEAIMQNRYPSMNLHEALSASANVPFAHAWTEIITTDKNWISFVDFLHQHGMTLQFIDPITKELVTADKSHIPDPTASFGNVWIVPWQNGHVDLNQSGAEKFLLFYQYLGEHFNDDESAKKVIDALTDDQLKTAQRLFTSNAILNFNSHGVDGSLLVFKTGTSPGVDFAVRETVMGIKIFPDGHVESFAMIASGQNSDGSAVPLDWAASTVLPALREIIDTEKILSPADLKQPSLMLDALFGLNGGFPMGKYQIGEISAQDLLKYIVSQNKEGNYSDLVYLLQHNNLDTLPVDIVKLQGQSIVSIHLLGEKGINQVISIPIKNGSLLPVHNLDFGTNKFEQEVINSLLREAGAQSPYYTDILHQINSRGVEFLSVGPNQTSPALLSIYKYMDENHQLFTSGEDMGTVLRRLGFDPTKTIIVNTEILKNYIDSNNPQLNDLSLKVFGFLGNELNFLKTDKIFSLALQSMPDERKLNLDGLDSILFSDNHANSSYYALSLIFDVKKASLGLTIPQERAYLVEAFNDIAHNGDTNAEDLIRAYNLFVELDKQMDNGVYDPSVALRFIEALQRIPKMDKNILEKLNLIPHGEGHHASLIPTGYPSSGNFTLPLAESLNSITSQDVVYKVLNQPAFYHLSNQDREVVQNLVEHSQQLASILNTAKDLGVTRSNRQLYQFIKEQFEERYSFDITRNHQLDSLFRYIFANSERLEGKPQCASFAIALDRFLHNGKITLESVGGSTAREMIPRNQFLTETNQLLPLGTIIRKGEFAFQRISLQDLFEKGSLHPGDRIVIVRPWFDRFVDGVKIRDPGHILTVILPDASEETGNQLLVADANPFGQGDSGVRLVSQATDLALGLDDRTPEVYVIRQGN